MITTVKYDSIHLLFQTIERTQHERTKQIPSRESSETGDLLDVFDFGQHRVQMLTVVCAEFYPVSALSWIAWRS